MAPSGGDAHALPGDEPPRKTSVSLIAGRESQFAALQRGTRRPTLVSGARGAHNPADDTGHTHAELPAMRGGPAASTCPVSSPSGLSAWRWGPRARPLCILRATWVRGSGDEGLPRDVGSGSVVKLTHYRAIPPPEYDAGYRAAPSSLVSTAFLEPPAGPEGAYEEAPPGWALDTRRLHAAVRGRLGPGDVELVRRTAERWPPPRRASWQLTPASADGLELSA